MKINELIGVMADSYQIGYMQAVKAYEPSQDAIRATEVKKWLRMMCIDEKTFKILKEKGFIEAVRKGKAINSPLYYSKAQIKAALAGINLARLVE